ncbi:MAG: hypothetical protein ACRDD9_17630 [Shewanella sp.]
MKGTMSAIALTLTLSLGGCASSSPWDNFPHQEAQAWQGIGVSAYDAQKFRSTGYTPTDVKSWVQAGMKSPDEIVAWSRAGFTAQEASRWIAKGFTLEKALEYKRQGLTVAG